MNIYDFDKTIYDGDSTQDFFMFCVRRRPALLLKTVKVLPQAVEYCVKGGDNTKMKEKFLGFLSEYDDIDREIELFWALHEKNIKKFYLENKKADDIIISASPEFLLEPMCKKLGVTLIGTLADKKTGKITGLNCRREEKVKRLCEYMNGTLPKIERFYSDSLSDTPLARLAEKAYMVKGEKITDWKIEK